MDANSKKNMHPLVAVAAVSVILFSLVGMGAITGLIPTSHSQSAATSPVSAAEPPARPVESIRAAEAADKPAPSAPKPARNKVAAKRTAPAAPMHVAMVDAPLPAAQIPPPQPATMVLPPKPPCRECGVIETVREIEIKGAATGSGAAIGGIAGGLLGRQTGNGRGRDVMTVLGAIGGAVAGHEVEKNVNKIKRYEIAIRFDDGTSRLITQDYQPTWRPGDRVKVVDSVITANNGY